MGVRLPLVRAGGVLGFGLGGLVDGIVLHQILQWHHLIADDTPAMTVEGLEANTLADGLFHLATLVVLVAGVALLWRARAEGRWQTATGGALVGFGTFHVVDEIVFHVVLDLHHIRMVETYLVYDLAFTAMGVALGLAGARLVRQAR